MRVLRALRRHGVLGINRRNAEYTLRWNPRAAYPLVDDKLLTKKLCARAGIPTPRLLAVAHHHFELRQLRESMTRLTSFVLKPAHGAMGNGILVIRERDGARFRLAGGRSLALDDLVYHAAGVISGLYALAGQTDAAIVEERLLVHPDFAAIASEGVPDVRVIVYRGVPVMAMTRLPTLRAGGRANPHQGAVAAGIDLESGRTTHAILQSRPIRKHPDTGEAAWAHDPGFADVLDFARRRPDGLGYVGADLRSMRDTDRCCSEMNARPGLMIQLANRAGLLPRLRAVDAEIVPRERGGTHRARRRDRARAQVSA
jgi:alpha-L-glutamate ligase-like protein